MYRKRAWRRYKNYAKAMRKRKIDMSSNWWFKKYNNDPFTFWIDGYRCGWYDNLHQYSKNKIHCSCPMCSAKTRNKGKRRHNKPYAPSINYSMMDKRRQMAMDEDEKEFFN